MRDVLQAPERVSLNHESARSLPGSKRDCKSHLNAVRKSERPRKHRTSAAKIDAIDFFSFFSLTQPLPSFSFSTSLPFLPSLPFFQDQVDAAIAKLKDLKLDQEKAHKAHLAATGGGGAATSSKKGGASKASAAEVFRASVANALERRLFYLPSFKIYGAVAGFYDYGPPGCAVKQNVTQLWRRHFVLEEGE